MKKIIIRTGEKHYPVFIGPDILNELKNYLNASQFVITDETVYRLHFEKLKPHLGKYELFILGAHPEENKNLETYEKCITFALSKKLPREMTVIAFGGGAVGDFAGFFASTYKRGVRFVNVPTTLLAHDSAIGGKTALNMGEIKNAIGTFYQPDAVFYDLRWLVSLTDDEILSGYGELFKHDFLKKGDMLQEIKTASDLRNIALTENYIYRAIQVKQAFIESDVEDRLGKRMNLNFGHTLGHALEISEGIPHGQAVLYGIIFALYLSGWDSHSYYQHFKQLGYFRNKPDIKIEQTLKLMQNDKKNADGQIRFVILKAFGVPLELKLPVNEARTKLAAFISESKEW